MEKELKIENTCNNCRYYSQHYSKQGTRYYIVHCGHCIHRNNKKMRPNENCERWEDISIKKEERKKSIFETLELMSERLEEFIMILTDDIKN